MSTICFGSSELSYDLCTEKGIRFVPSLIPGLIHNYIINYYNINTITKLLCFGFRI